MKRIQFLNDVTLFMLLAIILIVLYSASPISIGSEYVPASILMMSSLALSLFFEAIPFLLAGVVISGVIQVFVSEQQMKKMLPKHPILAVITGCSLGALFPACECGIVPIVRRLLMKGVPLYAAVAFMLTGPLINPLVALSTYMAFGQDVTMMLMRFSLGFLAAFIVALIVYSVFKHRLELKHTTETLQPFIQQQRPPFSKRLSYMGTHAIEEFFEMSKFFIVGAILAASVQTYLSSSSLFAFGDNVMMSTMMMMILAYLLSLCSEADAFIAASFTQFVPTESLLAFLLYGPMFDLKNTWMLGAVFSFRFVFCLFVSITAVVYGLTLAVYFL
ncbi:permease [Alkalihalobacterium bogoriense]|uniref:permease n=1 Tax=Alkalihalobacterium bogoriense TaxID=246272 RepID=UPI00047E7382|nr:permease [Alkalihalobacterium bogoriense]